MEPEARYFLVGTVVLILFALVAATVAWLSAAGIRRDDVPYTIYFEHNSLEGLPARGEVMMRGIPVGTVTDFRLSRRRPGAAEVRIRVETGTPIRTSTRAVVERQLVTGVASIGLINLDEQSPLLTQAPAGEPYPVIPEGVSRAEQSSESLRALVSRAEDAVGALNALLSSENQATVTEILENLRHLSRDANRALEGFEATLASTSAAAGEVQALGRGVHDDATTALREATAAIRELRADAKQLSERADNLLSSGDLELRATARALRETAEVLESAAQEIGDPGSVLFGPPEEALGPGEGR